MATIFRICCRVLKKPRFFENENVSYWKSTEEKIQSAGLDASEFLSVPDIMRRCLVQLLMLAFCDSLGECYFSGQRHISEDLAKSYMMGRYTGVEMVVRLAFSRPDLLGENDSNRNAGTNMFASVAYTLGSCACNICAEMVTMRRLPLARFLSVPNSRELAEKLEEAGYRQRETIADTWE